jgi:uncharacterized membrane protein (TIGR02234 family)
VAERPRSRSFGPTVLLGLAAAAATAVSAGRDWATASGSAAGSRVTASTTGSTSAPLAIALALVALAAWGVVLVLRGQARRVVAAVGALAAAGTVVAVVSSLPGVREDAVQAVIAKGGTGVTAGSLTGWYAVCGVTALLTLASLVVAVVVGPRWPAMGSRYDAPAARGPQPDGPVAEQDMWRALDDGRDPTL